MSKQSAVLQERLVEEILESDANPIHKAREIVRLGFDQDVADDIVGQYQIGQVARYDYFEKIGSLDDSEVYSDEDLEVDLRT